MKLRNGTVLPSGLLGHDPSRHAAAFNETYKNTALRAGVIVKVYETDDKRNISGLAPEYDVIAVEYGSGGVTTRRYKNCLSTDGLGSIADYFEKRFRKQEKFTKANGGQDFKGQDGAAVILLCLDGKSEKAIILGGLHHPDRAAKLDKDTAMAGELNGVRVSVKKDGSTNLTFRGATDNQGKPKDSSQGDTAIDIEKDGSFQVKNKGVIQRAQKDGEYSVIAEGGQTYSAKRSISITTDDKMSMSAKGDASLAMQNLLISAQGSATMSAQSLSIQTSGEGTCKGQMLSFEASAMLKLKSSMVIIDGFVSLGGPGGVPAPMLQTMYLGIGNLGSPVLSMAIGPFSAKVTIT
jgi:hypothetical protein